MTDIADLHARALDATGRIIDGVAADRWHATTPCADWDARGLVNHLVAGNLWAAELAAGGTIDSVGSRLDGDLLGGDPAAGHPRARRPFRSCTPPARGRGRSSIWGRRIAALRWSC